MDKYAAAFIEKDKVFKHLMIGQRGKLAKLYFFFLRTDTANLAEVKIMGKTISDGKETGPMSD